MHVEGVGTYTGFHDLYSTYLKSNVISLPPVKLYRLLHKGSFRLRSCGWNLMIKLHYGSP